MQENSKKILKSLIWQKFFRHNGIEQSCWKNKQCISLSKRLHKKGFSQPPSPRTLYNFSKTDKASDYTLSTLVHAVYNDNKEFMEYFDNDYNGNDELKWEAFADFTSWQSNTKSGIEELKEDKDPTIIPDGNNYSDPLIYIDKLLGGNFLLLFFFYLFIYSITVILLAFNLGVWEGIDYPLSQSYTVWIGYVFFAAAATFITLFNKQLFKLLAFVNGNATNLRKRLFSYKIKIVTLLLALIIATGLHYTFLTDQLHGWCESQPGKLSVLGFYHLILYAFNLWITFLFIYYYTNIGKIINSLAEVESKSKIGFCKNIKLILPLLSNLNIYYKLIVIVFGGFAILFFTSTILFMKNNNNYTLQLWQFIEIGVLIIMFVGFGFVLYWQYFAKNISNFLIAERNKQLLTNYMNQQEMVYALTLPSDPDKINQYAANILNILIWLITIILVSLIGTLLYIIN